MSKTFKDILIIVSSTLILTILVWLPYLVKVNDLNGLNFSNGFNTIYQNYDGIEYIIIAKTFYFPDKIAKLPQSLPSNYYAAHFPGYSLAILIFSPILGFLKSMLFVTVLFTILSLIAFYFLLKDFKLTRYPLILSLIALILPPRWLIVHSVGSSEPVFIFFVILTIYFLMKYEIKNKLSFILLSSISASLATLTRPPGVLLLISIFAFLLWKYFVKEKKGILQGLSQITQKYFLFILVPLSLLGLFWFYGVAYSNFFAYFNSGDNIHLKLPPYSVFNIKEFWVGDAWLEDIIYLFIIGFTGVVFLFRQNLPIPAFFVLTYLVAAVFVAHRDISRYVLPIFPFVLIAFERLLTSKEFRIVLLIVALGIYFYAQNFILNNTAPFPNLEYFN